MNFAQYLGGGGDPGPDGGVVDRGDLICFEDGTCMNRSDLPIGRPQRPGWVDAQGNAPVMSDQTGGPIVFRPGRRYVPDRRAEGDGTGGPAAQGSTGRASEFALLLEALKRRRR